MKHYEVIHLDTGRIYPHIIAAGQVAGNTGGFVRHLEKGKVRNMDYIPDKKLYAAVMFTKKMISEGTDPAIAVSRSGKYYGFSASEINKAMFSGVKRKKPSKKLLWWVTGDVIQTREASESTITNITVRRAASSQNACNKEFNCRLESYYDQDKFRITLNASGFSSKKEAENWVKSSEYKKEAKKYVW